MLSPFTGLTDIIRARTNTVVEHKEEAADVEAANLVLDSMASSSDSSHCSSSSSSSADYSNQEGVDMQEAPPKKKRSHHRKRESVVPGTIELAEKLLEAPQPPRKKQRKAAIEADIETRDDEARKLIAVLTTYGKNEILGPYLRDNHGFHLDPAKLRKLSNARLIETMADVEDVLQNKSTSAVSDALVRQGLYALEKSVENRTEGKYLVIGTTDKCFNNDHWRFLLERSKVKYGIGYGKLDPLSELTLITFQTAALVHQVRSADVHGINLDVPYVETAASTQ